MILWALATALVVTGAAVFAVVGSAAGFGWFAYASPPVVQISSGLVVVERAHIAGLGCVVLGLLLAAFLLGHRTGRRGV